MWTGALALILSLASPSPAAANRAWLMNQIDAALQAGDVRRAQLESPTQVQARQRELRDWLSSVIPALPRTTPGRARVSGHIECDGYRLEKILIEAQPGHHVTALLYLPDPTAFPPPWPGVLVACGHAHEGKAAAAYQKAAALGALHGLAVLVFDPLDQGERLQTLLADGRHRWWGTTAHNLSGGLSLLLGESQAAWEVRDAMAAVDYLQSRPDVKADRIGVMGNSGGGTQTSLLMVMDDRIKAAAPSCYITGLSELLSGIGPQDAEQFLPGQLIAGFDHAEFLTTRAPVPVLVCASQDDFFPIAGTQRTIDAASKVFAILDRPEAISLAVVEGPHGWHRPLRERSVEWMCRWLDDRVVTVTEPDITVLSLEATWVTPTGQVMRLDDERSIFDLIQQRHDEARAKQAEVPPQIIDDEDAFLSEPLSLPMAWALCPLESLPIVSSEIKEATIEGGVITTRLELTLSPAHTAAVVEGLRANGTPQIAEPDPATTWKLPVIRMQLEDSTPDRLRMIVSPDGVGAVAARQRPTEDTALLMVDPRFCGEALHDDTTRWQPFYGRFGQDGQPAVLLMMLGRSLPAVQAEDLMAVAEWAADGQPITLEVDGPPTMAARLAAAMWPQGWSDVMLIDAPESFDSFFQITDETPLIQRQFSTILPGAIAGPDLATIDEVGGVWIQGVSSREPEDPDEPGFKR